MLRVKADLQMFFGKIMQLKKTTNQQRFSVCSHTLNSDCFIIHQKNLHNTHLFFQ